MEATLKNKIIKGLHTYIGCPVVPTDTAAPRPGYPYLTYKVTSPMENRGGFNLIDVPVPSESPYFDYDVLVVREEQAQFTLSISAYSMSEDEANLLAIQAADWFKFIGYEYLKACNIVVVNVSSVNDRTVQIVDDYEKRYGFDVKCRAARTVSKRIEAIEKVRF